MLGQRLRRWANIDQTLGQYLQLLCCCDENQNSSNRFLLPELSKAPWGSGVIEYIDLRPK